MSKVRQMWSWALLGALVLLAVPTSLDQTLAREDAGPISALSRLQALAAAHPQGVPAALLRTSLREIVDQADAEKEKALCIPTTWCPCSKQPGCRAGYLSGPTRPDVDSARANETVIYALKAFEREARKAAGTVSAERFRALLSNLELASAAAQ